MQIPENIKQARISAGKTQQEMADLLGKKRTTYANWEENTEPDISTIREIAKILGVKFSQLISDVDDTTNETNKIVSEITTIVRLFHESLQKEQDNVKEANAITLQALKKIPDKDDSKKNGSLSSKTNSNAK